MVNTRREFCSFLGFALLGLNRKLIAQQESDFLAKSFQNSRGKRMLYRLFIPAKYESRQKYPLVLWLHGGAGRGDDNVSQISGGNTAGSHVWTLPENQTRYPCFVFAPQCPAGEEWATLTNTQPTEHYISRWKYSNSSSAPIASTTKDSSSPGNHWAGLEPGPR